MNSARPIQKGDLIQLNTWFNDAWSEVTEAHPPDASGRQTVSYVRRDKYGTRRRDCLSIFNHGGIHEDVRCVAKPTEVDPFRNNINLTKHRVRYGALWDAGEHIGTLTPAAQEGQS